MDQAAASALAFRFLRRAKKPIMPRPPANIGKAAGSGVAEANSMSPVSGTKLAPIVWPSAPTPKEDALAIPEQSPEAVLKQA